MTTEVRTPDNAASQMEAGGQHDDWARTAVPDSAKRGPSSILGVLVGFITAFFFPLLGGLFLTAHGAAATWVALAISFVVLIGLALIVARTAAREGLTSELITRGAGFGSVGSVLTAIIYAATFVIYAGTEGQILASSIDQLWDLPDQIWYVVVGALFLPMAWNGISSMTKILAWTVPIYFILLVAAIVVAWNGNGGMPPGMFTAMPSGAVGGVAGTVAVIASLASTVGINPFEAADYNRFVRYQGFARKALITVVLPYVMLFFVAIPLGMYFTLSTGEFNPSVYFVGLIGLLPGVALAWVSQIRVNLTNLHISSVTAAAAAETLRAPQLRRRFWIVAVTVASIALMWFNVLGNLTVFLDWLGIFLLSWVACVVADIVVVRRWLRIVTGPLEYRASVLRRWNPVGVVALLTGTVSASLLWFLSPDPIVVGLAAYIGFLVAFVTHALMAVITKGKYYFADANDPRRVGLRGGR